MPKVNLRIAARRDGFILVTVLWILAALSALASVYAVYISNTAMAAHSYASRVEADALVRAALELAAYQLMGDDATRPTSSRSPSTALLGGSRVDFMFQSEGARIDLNLAPKELLSGLFRELGAKPDEADFYADRIIAWRTKSATGMQNTEIDNYNAAGLSYGPRQAPFQNAAELRLVLGLPQQLIDAALPFVTVFNGQAGIDINEAKPEVVRALPHMSAHVLDEVLRRRDPRNPQAVLPLLGQAASSVAIGSRKAVRVMVHVTLESGRQVNADVVLLIPGNGPEPYRVLAWRDDFDGPV